MLKFQSPQNRHDSDKVCRIMPPERGRWTFSGKSGEVNWVGDRDWYDDIVVKSECLSRAFEWSAVGGGSVQVLHVILEGEKFVYSKSRLDCRSEMFHDND